MVGSADPVGSRCTGGVEGFGAVVAATRLLRRSVGFSGCSRRCRVDPMISPMLLAAGLSSGIHRFLILNLAENIGQDALSDPACLLGFGEACVFDLG